VARWGRSEAESVPESPGSIGVRRVRGYQDGAFAVEHQPTSGSARSAVLLLPSLGYEETCAYRPLRLLGDALAERGHLVQRLDWPGLGDSRGEASDEGLVAACVDAVRQATAALRARGLPRVSAIALRAGGLFAAAAGGLDELILWAAPKHGRAYLRHESVFHKMGETRGPPPPAGAVEAGGFLYGPATVADLSGLVLEELLEARPPARLVRLSREQGLSALLVDPYRAALDPPVLARLLDSVEAVPARPFAACDLAGELRGLGFLERPVVFEGGAGEIRGVLCEPLGAADSGATLLLNAGGIRRCGPGRLWTRAARELARQGRRSLRFDVRDVGDSDGANQPHQDLEAMYSEASIADAVSAHDWLTGLGAQSVDVVGLCSGSFLGAQLAARRPVRSALLFNCLAFVWNDDARASSFTAHIAGSLVDARRWRRLLTGRIDALALARAILDKARLSAGDALAQLRGQASADEVDQLLARVQRRGTRLHLVSSEGDPSIAYLHAHVPADRRPMLTILPGVDHTIRPVWAHPTVVDLVTAASE
jgi:pimeloyl-ACP methyl ester carboxylesterase